MALCQFEVQEWAVTRRAFARRACGREIVTCPSGREACSAGHEPPAPEVPQQKDGE